MGTHRSIMAPKQKAPCYVLGVGMTKFIKPRGKVDYTELGFEAGVKAMLDAQVNYDEMDTGVACYCYGDSTCGQRVFYQFGMTQIPIYNVNSNCSTGSTGLHLGRTMISGGMADAVLVVGFEKMFPGSLQSFFNDRANPTGTTAEMMRATRGITNAPGAAQMFGNAGSEYMEKYGAKLEDFAEIARVNHEHSKRNPYSQFQDEYSLEQVMKATMIHEPLTKLQCCPTSDGGAAAVLVSQDFLDARPHLKDQAVLIAGQQLCTDAASLFSRSSIDLMGYEMTKTAAKAALTEAKVDVEDVKVVELHDCFSANEMIVIDALGRSEQQRSPVGRHWTCPVCRAGLAFERMGQQPSRRRHYCRSSAQSRSRRGSRGDRIQARRWQEVRPSLRRRNWKEERSGLQPCRGGEGLHQGAGGQSAQQDCEERVGTARHSAEG